jgi:chromosome segregation ATPase
MESAQFDSLAAKVELAVSRLESLKGERDGLLAELAEMREKLEQAEARAAGLETDLTAKNAEIEGLRQDLEQRSENMTQAGDRVRDLVSRLEAALV